MKIRTDLADSGLYIFKNWVMKILDDLEREDEMIENSSIDVSLNAILINFRTCLHF